jgi:plastocyanin
MRRLNERPLLRATAAWTGRWVLLAGLALAANAVARSAEGGGPTGGGQKPAATVKMTDKLKFDPDRVKVKVGDEVLWTNTAAITHTVTDDASKARDPKDAVLPQGAPPFNSGSIDPGGQWRFRFTVPGRYKYFCMPHEAMGMLGEVEVVP